MRVKVASMGDGEGEERPQDHGAPVPAGPGGGERRAEHEEDGLHEQLRRHPREAGEEVLGQAWLVQQVERRPTSAVQWQGGSEGRDFPAGTVRRNLDRLEELPCEAQAGEGQRAVLPAVGS